MRTLVIFYSRTGNTRAAAASIARMLDADVEEIHERSPRRGLAGFLRSGLDATLERETPIAPLTRNPGDYDLVIVGTPAWNANIASPVRTCLARYRERFGEVAFFCTMGGRGAERVFDKMRSACGRRPITTLVVLQRDIGRATAQRRVESFAAALRTRYPDITPRPHPTITA